MSIQESTPSQSLKDQLDQLVAANLPASLSYTKTNRLSVQERFDILKKIEKTRFNEQQRIAVRHVSGPLLVLAGAGSGKTHVIAHRVANLIGLGYKPKKILAVTFTNKATGEMKERFSSILGERPGVQPRTYTLHKLASRIVRAHWDKVGFSRAPRIADDLDCARFIELAFDSLPLNLQNQLGEKPIETLKTKISLWKNTLIGPREAIQKREEANKALDDYVLNNKDGAPPSNEFDFADALVNYQKWLQRTNLLDVDDLLRLAVKILSDNKEIRTKWQKLFDFIMVDEYQDTNKAQIALLEILAKEHNNICVVGDDDQSIYGWRAADVEHIRTFASSWEDAKEIFLTVNYRCTPSILGLANTLMQHDIKRKEKELIAFSPDAESPTIRVYSNDYEEADANVDILKNRQAPYKEAVFLFRGRSQMKATESALKEAGIHYLVLATDELPMSQEKRVAYAALAAVHDPEDAGAGLLTLLCDSEFKVSKTDFTRILNRVEDSTNKTSLWESLNGDFVKNLSKEGRKNVRDLVRGIKKFHRSANDLSRKESLSKIAGDVLTFLYPESFGKSQTREDLTTEKMTAVQNFVKSWEEDASTKTFRSFLGWSDRIRKKAKEPMLEEGVEDYVTLSTYHAAKGLEYKCVFMPCLSQKVIPHRKALEEFMGTGSTISLDEERRLFYVGITRAKTELHLSWPQLQSGRRRFRNNEPSQFIAECGADKLYNSDNLRALNISKLKSQPELF